MDAVIGVVFAVLCTGSLGLIRVAVPSELHDPGIWLSDPGLRHWVDLGLQLARLVAIVFLWFMAALRSRLGSLDDPFFSTLFLGSGLLSAAMLFVSGAVARGILATFDGGSTNLLQDSAYVFARTTSYTLVNTFAVKAAAMFMFVCSTIGHRTGLMRRPEYMVGYLFGLVLLLVITDFAWIFVLFPVVGVDGERRASQSPGSAQKGDDRFFTGVADVMTSKARRTRASAGTSDEVRKLYEPRPCPAPLTSIDRQRETYSNPAHRRALFH